MSLIGYLKVFYFLLLLFCTSTAVYYNIILVVIKYYSQALKLNRDRVHIQIIVPN